MGGLTALVSHTHKTLCYFSRETKKELCLLFYQVTDILVRCKYQPTKQKIAISDSTAIYPTHWAIQPAPASVIYSNRQEAQLLLSCGNQGYWNIISIKSIIREGGINPRTARDHRHLDTVIWTSITADQALGSGMSRAILTLPSVSLLNPPFSML